MYCILFVGVEYFRRAEGYYDNENNPNSYGFNHLRAYN
jgi:hypothetical protein